MAGDKAVDLLGIIKRHVGGDTTPGLRIVRVVTTEPNPITFVFEGDSKAVAMSLFEIPISLYPLRRGDRLFVYPITETGESQRWGALEKLTGGAAMGTMQSPTSVLLDGIDKVYGPGELIVPPYIIRNNARASDPHDGSHTFYVDGDLTPLEAGDRVSVAPSFVNGGIVYVVFNWYGKGG